jgi:hypothetical protein
VVKDAQLIFAWFLPVLLLVGLVSAVLSRRPKLNLTTRFHRWRVVFVAAVAMAGSAAIVASAIGPGSCMTAGASLAVMVLAAVWDTGNSFAPRSP